MAFRRHIASEVVSRQGVQALWTESEQAARRCMAIMKQGKTLERLTVSDLDRPDKVWEQRRKGKK